MLYGGSTGLWLAATLLGALVDVRQSLVGLLTLHTLPTRETFSLVRTLQVVLGSLAIVAGLGTGGTLDVDASGAVVGWAVAGCYEAARALLMLAMIWLHRGENLAKP